MKQKLMLIALSVILILSMAACSSAETTEAAAPASDAAAEEAPKAAADGAANADTDEEKGPRLAGETPASTQLLFGTFALEETDLAVDAAQARELLPLWKAVRSLSNSDTASSVELEALYNQIQDLMTAEQLDQIDTMEFGPENMQEVMSELGLDMAMGNRGKADDSEDGANTRPGGGMGGPGDSGPGSGPGGENATDEQRAMMEAMSDEERATAMAERGGGAMNPMNTMLLDPLIELLSEKAAS
jgi:hypothetical protein